MPEEGRGIASAGDSCLPERVGMTSLSSLLHSWICAFRRLLHGGKARQHVVGR